MSQETQAWAKDIRTGDVITKAVLLELCNWARPSGIVEFLSIAHLSEVVEVSPRTVQRHLLRLEKDLQLIRRVSRHREDGGQGANCFELIGYQPPLGALASPRRSVTPPVTQRHPPGDASVTPPGDAAVTRLGDKIIPPTDPDGSASPKGAELPLGDEQFAENANKPKPARQRARGVRIDPEWKAPPTDELPDDIREFVKAWATGEYQRQATKFLNHWLASSGRNAAKRDWARTWHNWLIETEERGLVKRSAAGAGSPGRRGSTNPVPRAGEGEISEKIRVRVSKRLGKVAYQQWIGPAAMIVTEANAVEIRCPSEFHASHLERNYEVDVLRACRETIGERFGGVKFLDWSGK